MPIKFFGHRMRKLVHTTSSEQIILLPMKSTKKNNALSSVDSRSDYKYIFKSF